MVSPTIAWVSDPELGTGFVQSTLRFPNDYDGPVTATLVRNDPLVSTPRGAVLYLHGFIDYFFQSHVAHAFNRAHFDFYALDLRKYGRSLGQAAHPNFCHNLDEYYPEVTAAIDVIANEGHAGVVLAAHSTGALTAAMYAKHGERRDRIVRIILNSPFLDFKEHRVLTRSVAALGVTFPFWTQREPVSRWYARSLHADHYGEWRFNLEWKPIAGFDAYYGWVRAVVRAQDRIAAGLGLPQPVLVIHSDKSARGSKWSDEFLRTDVVLDVNDIRRLSPRLGTDVIIKEIPGGLHDLVLSAAPVRHKAITVMLDWLLQPLR